MSALKKDIEEIIDRIFPIEILDSLGITENDIKNIQKHSYIKSLEDFGALVDHTQSKKSASVRKIYSCKRRLIRAILYYRIANSIYYCNRIRHDVRINKARKITEEALLETGIEIHPSTKIGRKFVIDYGYYSKEKIDTRICGNVKIGDNFYIQEGAQLFNICNTTDNLNKKYIFGNNVKIGSFTRLVNPVSINDDVSVSPFCIINQDIDSGYMVWSHVCYSTSTNGILICDQSQMLDRLSDDSWKSLFFVPNRQFYVFGIVPEENSSATIYGQNLNDVKLSLVDENLCKINEIKVSKISNEDNFIKINFFANGENSNSLLNLDLNKLFLRMKSNKNDYSYILSSEGLRQTLSYFIRGCWL